MRFTNCCNARDNNNNNDICMLLIFIFERVKTVYYWQDMAMIKADIYYN